MIFSDRYPDLDEFQTQGGLLGRLLLLQREQGQYQPGPGFGPTYGRAIQGESTNVPEDVSPPKLPLQTPIQNSQAAAPAAWQPPDHGQTQNIRIGDYWMPQFGRAQ